MKKWMLPVVIGVILMFGNIGDVKALECTYDFKNNWSIKYVYTESSPRYSCTHNGVNVSDCRDGDVAFGNRITFSPNSGVTQTVINYVSGQISRYRTCPELYYADAEKIDRDGYRNGIIYYISVSEENGYSKVPMSVSDAAPETQSCDGYKEDLVYVYTAWKNAADESRSCLDPNACTPTNYRDFSNKYSRTTKELKDKLEEMSKKYDNCTDAQQYIAAKQEEINAVSNDVERSRQAYTERSSSLSSQEQSLISAANKQYQLANKQIQEMMDLNFSTILSCKEVLGSALKYVEGALNIIQIAAPILLIVLGSVDLSGAVISNDNDAIKKATSKLVRRAIAAIAIFFVPLLVKLLLDMAARWGGLPITDALCGLAYIVKGGIL